MRNPEDHPCVEELRTQLADGKIHRREFLRLATLLGVSAGSAYALAGIATGRGLLPAARAAMPRGGLLRIAMRVQELKHPHTYEWYQSEVTRNVCEYLVKTGADNITRGALAERWDVSDDIRSWTFHLRRGVKWHSGRDFTADDVLWNLRQVLDPKVGSSMLSLMEGYMLVRYDTGKVDKKGKPVTSTRLWDANAIEKVDDFTIRLNLKEPQIAVPEHLFHYPMHIMDPAEHGVFGPGANGTGAFTLEEASTGVKAVLKAHPGYWGEGPYLDEVQFLDLGDEPGALVNAFESKQVDGAREVDTLLLSSVGQMSHMKIYEVVSARTGVARMRVDHKPFDDPRVRKAMRLAIDTPRVLKIGNLNYGAPGEHHHVCPIHPEYAKLPFFKRNVEEAKKLLAEAGYPNGFKTEIACKKSPPWEVNSVQVMKEMWADIGVDVKINVMPASSYWDIWKTVPFGFTSWTHRPLGVMVLELAYRTGVRWNESGYSNHEFDRLLTKAEGTVDVDKRRKIMARLEKIMQEDGPIVQPLWRSQTTAFDRRVKGFKPHPAAVMFANEMAIET